MNRPTTLVLPAQPPTGLSPRSCGRRRAQLLQQYAIDVYDALARACRAQVGAVLPEPAVIAAHFTAFTEDRPPSSALHARYGVSLPSRAGS